MLRSYDCGARFVVGQKPRKPGITDCWCLLHSQPGDPIVSNTSRNISHAYTGSFWSPGGGVCWREADRLWHCHLEWLATASRETWSSVSRGVSNRRSGSWYEIWFSTGFLQPWNNLDDYLSGFLMWSMCGWSGLWLMLLHSGIMNDYNQVKKLVWLGAGGDGHHFRVVQLPYNLSMQDAATINTQVVKGKRMSLLNAAQKLGVSVVASASLMQVSFKMDCYLLSVTWKPLCFLIPWNVFLELTVHKFRLHLVRKDVVFHFSPFEAPKWS